ncbi:MAG: 5-(carboxyamino)imidazole ribonucleotide synthase [Pseudomonadota bacterium]
MSAAPLKEGAVIGILGGGQMGRMLAVAASRLGLRVHVYDPAAHPPAGDVAWKTTQGDWDDRGALGAFADAVDVVTYEFENVPEPSLDAIEAAAPVFPPRRALAISQDRLTEKEFLTSLGLSIAPYKPVGAAGDIPSALAATGAPAILKTRRLGYDGKGQAPVAGAEGAKVAWAAIGAQPAVLEGRIAFDCEISVIAARGQGGATAAFEPGENLHREGILRTTKVPASVSADTAARAVQYAERILSALDYVGVIGVEFFVQDGALLVNEFAPRVHNSGHWTQNGALPDQFEAHIRAIAGWPLPPPRRIADVEMENLIGEDVDRAAEHAADPGTALHLYGKAETRPGRKMGHLNRVWPKGEAP